MRGYGQALRIVAILSRSHASNPEPITDPQGNCELFDDRLDFRDYDPNRIDIDAADLGCGE